MSNFQRTRSKVWWGDSPPNISSPLPQPPAWNEDRGDEWEPQLPHWIANEPEQQRNNSLDNVAQQPNNANQWPLRHGSPGSHKSQDSGFSDSDSSPPPSQYYPSPEDEKSNKSSNSSDSNNNQNVTVKQVVDLETSSKDMVDSAKTPDNSVVGVPTPKPRLRSSSVIQTPYDLQKYYEIHDDKEHMELLKDTDSSGNDNINLNRNVPLKSPHPSPRNINKELPAKPSPRSNTTESNSKIEIRITPPNNSSDKENTPNISAIEKDTKEIPAKNINVLSPSKKYPPKKSFVSSKDSTKTSKVALVKDLETSKIKSDESLEYIKLSDNNEIAVNNQPRIRSPISNISYVPTERSTTKPKPEFRRSISNEDTVPIITTPKFQRNRLNKSLNFEAQRLDQQILDIQDGTHSLEYIDEKNEESKEDISNNNDMHAPKQAILGKNIMDSLHLKPIKKIGPKAKQRTIKADKMKDSSFKLFPIKRDKPGIVESHAGGIMEGSRVPALGLPRSSERDSWVIVGHPEKEMLIPHYNERLVATESDINLKAKDEHNFDDKKLPPPPQFQDRLKKPDDIDGDDLTHDSKREKLKDEERFYENMNFTDVQINLACTSTPKMLTPDEFMNMQKTPKTTSKKTKVNLLDNFNG